MKVNEIMISERDHERLMELVNTFQAVDPELINCQILLKEKLEIGIIKKNEEIAEGLAQLNSVVTVSTSFGRKVGLELVLPHEADFSERKLSVLSPLGTALFGINEGGKSLWHFPNGDEWITIEKVDNSLLNKKEGQFQV